MRPTATLLLLGVVAGAAPARAQGADPAAGVAVLAAGDSSRYLGLGERIVEWFFAGQTDSLLATMTPALAESLGGAEGLRKMMDQVAEIGGMPLEVLERKVVVAGGHPIFWWEAAFSEFTAEPVVFLWTFDASGRLTALDADPKSNVQLSPEG